MIKTQELTVNMGPQHPSTHGVFRCVLTLDGEYITSASNHTGYLHRGLEKLAEARTYTQFIPYTDRLDYVGGILNNWSYCLAVEKLFPDLQIPERAEYIRVILGELQRIGSHLILMGTYALDVAAWTGLTMCFRDREKVLDLLEMITGSRLTHSFVRIGGVSADISDEFIKAVKDWAKDFPAALEEYRNFLLGNEVFQSRMVGVGTVTKEMALDWGFTGPNLRCCGVPFDLRKSQPYSVYDQFDFDVPTLENGDCYDRFLIRLLECEQSLKIVLQALEQLPDGPIMAKVPKVLKPPVGTAFANLEATKGILGFYVVSDGTTKPYRLHIHSPAFVNLGIFPELAKGAIIQDAVAILAGIDLVLGEIDR